MIKFVLKCSLVFVISSQAYSSWFTSDGKFFEECLENRRSDIQNEIQLRVAEAYCRSKHPYPSVRSFVAQDTNIVKAETKVPTKSIADSKIAKLDAEMANAKAVAEEAVAKAVAEEAAAKAVAEEAAAKAVAEEAAAKAVIDEAMEEVTAEELEAKTVAEQLAHAERKALTKQKIKAERKAEAERMTQAKQKSLAEKKEQAEEIERVKLRAQAEQKLLSEQKKQAEQKERAEQKAQAEQKAKVEEERARAEQRAQAEYELAWAIHTAAINREITEYKAKKDQEWAMMVPAEQAAAIGKEVAQYKAKIIAKIRRNIVMLPDIPYNARAEFDVTLLPGGMVLNAILVKPSGNAAYDSAVERAIKKAEPFPVPSDPALLNSFRELHLKFSPRE